METGEWPAKAKKSSSDGTNGKKNKSRGDGLGLVNLVGTHPELVTGGDGLGLVNLLGTHPDGVVKEEVAVKVVEVGTGGEGV